MNHKKTQTSNFITDKLFAQAADDWLAERKKTVTAATYDKYEFLLDRYLLPRLSNRPVTDITVQEIDGIVEEFSDVTRYKENAIGEHTIYFIRTIAESICRAGSNEPQPLVVASDLKKNPYPEITPEEMERVCFCAKYVPSREMLSVLLALFDGVRPGEICALHWDDVNLSGREIFIHQTVYRLKNRDGESDKKTCVQIVPIARKKQIRTVVFPEELASYMERLYDPGHMVMTGEREKPLDTRTLMYRVERIFADYQLEGISFQRLCNTYTAGSADTAILSQVLTGRKGAGSYANEPDIGWLLKEMTIDLNSLRHLIGLSRADMGQVIGLPESVYTALENGEQELKWSQYLALLFFFRYNRKTEKVVEALGLYPDSLKETLSYYT